MADETGTGIISTSKLVKVLGDLKTSPQDTLAVLRMVGVATCEKSREGSSRVRVDKLVDFLRNRPNERDSAEHALFVALGEEFRKKGINLESAYKFFDLDGNKQLSLAELKIGLETLKIATTKR